MRGIFSKALHKHRFGAFALGSAGLLGCNSALAQNADPNGPVPWGLGFQPAVTPVMERLTYFHDIWLMPVITVISVFVLLLLIYVVLRFNERANPTPTTTTHNSFLEVAWTAIPAVILMILAIPSFSHLYFMEDTSDADMTLKVTGHQWYWEYSYPDHGDLNFEAFIIRDENDVPAGNPRLLEADNMVVVPADTKVKVQITAGDVLHSWAMQPFGVKMDAVPGRINETWFEVPGDKVGIYYGQCQEICGTDHAFMPIMMQVVPKDEFEAWVEKAKVELALGNPTPRPEVGGERVKFASAN